MDSLTISPLLGILVKYAVSHLRDAAWFPHVNPDDKGRVLAVAGVLSALIAIIAELGTGQLSELSLNTLINTLATAISTFSTSVAYHEVSKSA